ncbi:hypothetical protein JOE63_001525 [Cellulosimicrobium cellulans]|jgi:hypothetical protein|uniref:Uncharacterized protein n=1 Tax=Cellulosimicrobium cellulans TaxID=1710 RepID=A0A1Y0HY11_CELCE|nr:hypothetical protein [Cellulosimicrobium cellulans]ARU52416.1 hypothetical protein CBR64_14070 [Cellulosimicrobium cellulans]MBM7819048.1 hypothetical protein [Cellulosimicrobium cellulans]
MTAPTPLLPVGRERLRRREAAWWWLAVPAVVLLAAVVFVVWTIVSFATHDALELVEDDQILAAAAEPCAQVTEAGATLASAATATERAAAALQLAQGARALATAVGAVPTDVLDADRPARSWADDWAVLADRLEAWSASVAVGEDARFELPLTEDGWSVVTRMDLAAPPDCPVPTSLVDLDATPPRTPEPG